MKLMYWNIILISLIVLAIIGTSYVFFKDNPIDLNLPEYEYVDYNDRVTVDYELIVDNELIETTFNDDTNLSFVVGSGKVIKGFDLGVLGLSENAETTLIIDPENAYGLASEYPFKSQEDLNLIMDALKEQLGSDVNIANMRNATFYNLYGQKCIFEDYNLEQNVQYFGCQHQLAGQTLNFKIQVLNIEKAGDYLESD